MVFLESILVFPMMFNSSEEQWESGNLLGEECLDPAWTACSDKCRMRGELMWFFRSFSEIGTELIVLLTYYVFHRVVF